MERVFCHPGPLRGCLLGRAESRRPGRRTGLASPAQAPTFSDASMLCVSAEAEGAAAEGGAPFALVLSRDEAAYDVAKRRRG